jgi:uncharacterized protein YndB with AHSA1/START domain
MKTPITVEVLINAPIEKIWEYWTAPEHITNWCFASEDWCAPRATQNLVVGEKFTTRMESTDGKNGFDMEGTYTAIEENKLLEYVMPDGRKVKVEFVPEGEGYKIVETFDPEDENTPEMQKAGWQAILDNFKKYITEE